MCTLQTILKWKRNNNKDNMKKENSCSNNHINTWKRKQTSVKPGKAEKSKNFCNDQESAHIGT